jgi:hypothetical protein
MYSREKIIETLHEIHDESKSIAPYVKSGRNPRPNLKRSWHNPCRYDGLFSWLY